MARPLRLEYENAFYHVIARGERRDNIFRSDADRKKFLSKLAEAVDKFHLKIHAYVLMGNHYHLLVETPEANLVKLMHDLNASYANWYRFKYNIIGSIFQGRYKAIVVEKDEYLLMLSAYIHLNPVRAGIVKNPGDYDWSSFRSYAGKSKTLDFLHMADILSKFRGKKSYEEFVINFSGKQEMYKHEEIYGINSILGSNGFIRRVLCGGKNIREREKEEEVLGTREWKQVAGEDIIEIMLTKLRLGIEEEELFRKRKGNPYRKLLVYALRRYTGMSLREVGELMGMRIKAVSEMARSFAKEMEREKDLRRLVEKVEKEVRVRSLSGQI